MTNNAPVYWEIQKVDGTWFSLHTYAWSVKSSGGRRWVSGAKRGEDLIVPHRSGRVWIPKTREAQAYDLSMWVFPTNEDGSKDTTKTVEQKAHQNFRTIMNAMDQDGQFLMRKRWHKDTSIDNDFGTQTNVASAIGRVEFIDGSGPDSDDGHGFDVSLSLSMADPYFYENVITGSSGAGVWTPASKAATAQSLNSSGSTALTLTGEASTDHIWISMSALSGDTKVTFPDGNWIELQASGLTDKTSEIMIDFREGYAIRQGMTSFFTSPSGTYLNGVLRRNPSFTKWPTLDPIRYPSSSITCTGGGTIKIVYDPAYR